MRAVAKVAVRDPRESSRFFTRLPPANRSSLVIIDFNWSNSNSLGTPPHSVKQVSRTKSSVRRSCRGYIHSPLIEGHTVRGQSLGSITLLSGGGSTIAVSRIQKANSRDLGIEILPLAQNQEGGSWNGHQNGSVITRYSERRLRRHAETGFTLETAIGYGAEGRSGLLFGVLRSF